MKRIYIGHEVDGHNMSEQIAKRNKRRAKLSVSKAEREEMERRRQKLEKRRA